MSAKRGVFHERRRVAVMQDLGRRSVDGASDHAASGTADALAQGRRDEVARAEGPGIVIEHAVQYARRFLVACIVLCFACSSGERTGQQSAALASVQPAQCLIYGAGDVPGASHFFSVNLRTAKGEILGPAERVKGTDGLAIHPETRILYAVGGRDNGAPDKGKSASLFQVDASNGAQQEVGSIGFSSVRGLSFRATDKTLWTWVRTRGLVQIDVATGRGDLRFANTLNVTALAWSNDGASLYLAEGRKLWVYQPSTGSLTAKTSLLPEETIALQVRPDDLLLGVLENPQPASSGNSSPHDPTVLRLFTYEVAQGQQTATFDVPTDAISMENTSPPKRLRRFSAIAWANGCGNPSGGGRADIIVAASVDRTQVCSGDSVFVEVNAVHPENPTGRVDIIIDGLPGSARYVQFPTVPSNAFVPGPRTITIAASTPEGHTDLEHVQVNVVDCGNANAAATLRVLPNPFHEATADFTVTSNVPALSFLGGVTYVWDFGDGTGAETSVPYVMHSYADRLPRDEIYAVFQARLTVRRPFLPDLVTPKTVTVTNLYALHRLRGSIRPPVRDASELTEAGGAFGGQFTVKNLEAEAITFNRRRLEYRYCDPGRDPTLLAAETVDVTIASLGQAVQSVSLANLPGDVCGVAVHLLGHSSGGLPLRSSAYLDIPARAPRQIIQNERLVATLNRLKDQGLLANPNRVTDEDLFRLVHERKILPANIAEPSSSVTSRSTQAVGLGDECEPGETPPDPSLTCLPTGEWSEPQALIVNAQKGDILLVSACSFIGTLLRQLTPIQRYSHEGIMTRNFSEVSQSTSSEDRALADDNHVGILGSDGVKADVLKFGWPGVLHQDITRAFRGETRVDPLGKEYVIDAFSPNPVKCPSDRMITHPLVVRPPLESPPAVRAELHRAADVAQSLEGHYRFYAYTEGNVGFHDGFNSPLDGKPATVSSQFIWWALRTAGLTLEGPSLEQKDANGLAGLHFGGAMVDGNTDDGLYLYTKDEREAAGEWMYDFIHGKVLGTSGTFGQFALDAPANYANQLVNCFAWDFCGTDDTSVPCGLDEDQRDDVIPSGCCVPLPPPEDPSEPPPEPEPCEAKDLDIWRNPGEGHAVSPDNFMFWDQPASTEGAEIGEDGFYGDFERMIYRDSARTPVFRWAPKQGFAAVRGRVIIEGNLACVANDECPAGDTCQEKTCKHACTADADCPTGAFCHDDGFCARVVPNATVFFAEAVSDTIRVTDADGRFAAFENIPVSGQPSEINARLVTDPDPNVVGDESVQLGNTQFTLEDQTIADITILLRPTNPTLRQVTATGLAHMIDCDCDSANETGDRSFFLTCRVDPDHPVDNSIHISQDNMCVDEIGIEITGECLLLAGQNDRTVRMQGTVRFFEGEEDSCGGTEQEDSFSFAVDIPPAELHPPGTRFNLNMKNGLKHEDVCVYVVAVVDCDDEAWGTGAASAVNEIQF